MSRQPDHREQRVTDYLRRRGDARLPASFTEDVARAAAATPQVAAASAPWWRMPLLAATMVVLGAVLTLGTLSLIDNQIGDGPTPSPSAALDTPLPSRIASPTASGAPAPSSSPEPTSTPTGSPFAVGPDEVLVSVTDNLVVRTQPGVGSDSEVYAIQLQPGDLLRLIDGPVVADGYEWYQGRVMDPTAPDGTRIGWVAAADQDGTPWLASVPPEGDGWRFLGEDATGIEPYTVGVATSANALSELWADAGLDAPIPDVDFGREIVVRYTHAVSGTCPEIELAGVGFDTEARILYSVAIIPSSPLFDGRACTTDANPHSFVVAVDRDRLPSGEILVRLQRGFIACPECGFESEQDSVTLP